jgi:hypothetical protein
MSILLSESSVSGKVSQPVPHQFESFALNTINTHPALPLVGEQTGGLKNLEVPRCGLPRVLEDGRYFAGRHGAAVEVNGEQYAPPGSMGQGGKHRFVRVNSPLGFSLSHTKIFSHTAKYMSRDISPYG